MPISPNTVLNCLEEKAIAEVLSIITAINNDLSSRFDYDKNIMRVGLNDGQISKIDLLLEIYSSVGWTVRKEGYALFFSIQDDLIQSFKNKVKNHFVNEHIQKNIKTLQTETNDTSDSTRSLDLG